MAKNSRWRKSENIRVAYVLTSQTLKCTAQKNSDEKRRVEARLDEELERLGVKLGLNRELRVVWMPNVDRGFSGEVREGLIYIYEAEENQALQALRHELIDYLITSRLVKPLVDLVNILIKSREAEIYKEKEKLVQMFSNILV